MPGEMKMAASLEEGMPPSFYLKTRFLYAE